MQIVKSCLIAFVSSALLLSSGCSARARAERFKQRGDAAFEEKEYATAKLEYLNAYRKGSRNPQLLERLAECFLKDGDARAAYTYLVQARDLQPTNVAVRAKLGALYFLGKSTTNAIAEAEAILKIVPDQADALLLLTDISTNKEQIATLTTRLQTLERSHPTNSAIPFALGVLSHKSKNLDAAKTYYEKSLALQANQPKVHMALAELARLQKDTNTADAQFRAAAALAPTKSRERLKEIEHLISTKRQDEAEKLLIETVTEEPEFVQALNMLVELLISRNKLDQAEEYAKKALAAAPQSRDAQINRSLIKLQRRDTDGALADLQALSKNLPGDAGVRFNLAIAYLAKGDIPNGLTSLDSAVSLDPKNIKAVLLRSELQMRTRNIDAAIPELIRISQEFPRLTQSRFLLATAYSAKREFGRALELYQALAKEQPKDPRPHYYAGICQRRLKQPSEARASFEASLKVLPTYLPSIEEIINLDIAEKKFVDASGRIDEFLKQYPDKPTLLGLKAKVLLAEKKVDAALATLEKAVEIDPNFQVAQRAIADIYLATGKPDEAIAKLQSMASSKPKDFNSRLQLALLHEAKKDYKAAQSHYESVLAIRTNHPVALNNLAAILLDRLGNVDAGLEYARRAREAAPTEPAVADTYGWALFKKGDYARALPLFEESAEKLPENPEVAYHLGMAYYMSGAEQPAIRELESAYNSTNNFVGKEEARAALAIARLNPTTADAAAIQRLEKAVTQNPRDVMAIVKLAQVYEHLKNWVRADELYQAALKINPASQPILTALARLNAHHLQNRERALDYAKQSWAIATSPELAATLGEIGYLAGDFKWASSVLSDARRAQPDNARLPFLMALSSYASGDLQQAKSLVQNVLLSRDKVPPLAKPTQTLLQFQIDPSKDGDAAAAVTSALQTDPGFPPALIVSGMLAERRKDFTGARAQYETVLKRFPSHAPAQRQLGLLLAEKLAGDDQAVPLLNAARPVFLGDSEIAKALGKIAYRRGDYREAARLLKDASLRLANDADLLYHLGLSQARLNETDAQDSLTRALKLDASAALAADAKKALEAMK